MFGNNNKEGVTLTQLEEMLAPIIKRMAQLETTVKEQTERIAQLESIVADTADVAHVADTSNEVTADEDREGATTFVFDVAQGGGTTQVYYLPAPAPNGVFVGSSLSEQVGKSIYQLTTEDGMNGRFNMIATPDAVATAMISVSQFVKPVCRIEGNTHRVPRTITTLEDGLAQKEGDLWRVTRKARVVFE